MPIRPPSGFRTKADESDYLDRIRESLEESNFDLQGEAVVTEMVQCCADDGGSYLVHKYGADRIIVLARRCFPVATGMKNASVGARLITVEATAGENVKYLAFATADYCASVDNGSAWALDVMQELIVQESSVGREFVCCMLGDGDVGRTPQDRLGVLKGQELEFDRAFIDEVGRGYFELLGSKPMLRARPSQAVEKSPT
jgi:hypothetical protein